MTMGTTTADRMDAAAAGAVAAAEVAQEGWGYCPKCPESARDTARGRWRSYETGHCPVCGHALEGQVKPDKELALSLFPLLLRVQELESDDVKQARSAGFWYNATTDEVRRMVRELTATAVMARVMLPQDAAGTRSGGLGAPVPPRQIMTMEDGTQVEVEMAGGRLRVLRHIPVAAAAPLPPQAVAYDAHAVTPAVLAMETVEAMEAMEAIIAERVAAALREREREQERVGADVWVERNVRDRMEYRGVGGGVAEPRPTPAPAPSSTPTLPFDPARDSDAGPPAHDEERDRDPSDYAVSRGRFAGVGEASAKKEPPPARTVRQFTKACEVCGEAVTGNGGFGVQASMRAHQRAEHGDVAGHEGR